MLGENYLQEGKARVHDNATGSIKGRCATTFAVPESHFSHKPFASPSHLVTPLPQLAANSS